MQPTKIYLADDDSDDREFFSDALSELPIQISLKTFENGVDLMADLFSDEALPQTIFLDLKMPMMNGFECLQDIKSEKKFEGIIIIIYSTTFDTWEIEKLKNDGANGYLQKPNSFHQLKTVLHKCLDYANGNHNKEDEVSPFLIVE